MRGIESRRASAIDMKNPEGKDKEGLYRDSNKEAEYPSFEEHMKSMKSAEDLYLELARLSGDEEEVQKILDKKKNKMLESMDRISSFGRVSSEERRKREEEARQKVLDSFKTADNAEIDEHEGFRMREAGHKERLEREQAVYELHDDASGAVSEEQEAPKEDLKKLTSDYIKSGVDALKIIYAKVANGDPQEAQKFKGLYDSLSSVSKMSPADMEQEADKLQKVKEIHDAIMAMKEGLKN